MASYPLIIAPHPIFRQNAEPVTEVNDEIRHIMDKMLETMYVENGVGIGANMVGILQQIIVVDLQEGEKQPLLMANPTITSQSETTQTFTEASLCYPGISADITRPNRITVSYLDDNNRPSTLDAEGFLASVIQHEIDYLHGKIFLDYLPRAKRDILLQKMQKYKKKMARRGT